MAMRAKTAKTTKKTKTSPRNPTGTAKPARKASTAAGSKLAQVKPSPPTAKKKPATGTKPAKKAGADRSPKTRPEPTSVASFLAALADPQQRADSEIVLEMMRAATDCEPVMWGSSIVGFDQYHYRYDSGREGDMPIVGFSPRKQSLVLYIMPGFADHEALLARLGKHSAGKSCLYVKRLADVDRGVLERLVRGSVEEMRRRHRAGQAGS